MTPSELLRGLARLRQLGFATLHTSTPTPAEALAALQALNPTELASADEDPVLLPLQEPLPGEPLRLGYGLAAATTEQSLHGIDFRDDQAIGRLDVRQKRASLEHRELPAGTLLYIGFLAEEDHSGEIPATPFNRILQTALARTDRRKRAGALASFAARLSWSRVKESVLAEAVRTARLIPAQRERGDALAMIASQYPAERQPDYLEEAQRTTVVQPKLALQPVLEEGRCFGRFVMLRSIPRSAIAYFSASPYLEHRGTNWRAFYKVVRFPAEVEVAPTLLRLSLEEAAQYDRTSLPEWQRWLRQQLPTTPLQKELLALAEKG